MLAGLPNNKREIDQVYLPYLVRINEKFHLLMCNHQIYKHENYICLDGTSWCNYNKL